LLKWRRICAMIRSRIAVLSATKSVVVILSHALRVAPLTISILVNISSSHIGGVSRVTLQSIHLRVNTTWLLMQLHTYRKKTNGYENLIERILMLTCDRHGFFSLVVLSLPLFNISVDCLCCDYLVYSFQIGIKFKRLRNRLYPISLVKHFINLIDSSIKIKRRMVRNLRSRAQNFPQSKAPF
jgi:hypothetical protein